jgi:hypothetical protein
MEETYAPPPAITAKPVDPEPPQEEEKKPSESKKRTPGKPKQVNLETPKGPEEPVEYVDGDCGALMASTELYSLLDK